MATSTSAQPVSEAVPSGHTCDQFVTRRLEHAGFHVKIVDLATSALLIVTVVLGVLLTVCVIDGWIMALGPWLRSAVLVGLVSFIMIVLVRSIGPLLLWRINPAYAARMIEQGEPKFKNSLLNYVFLKSRPGANSQRVFEAVQSKAAHDLSAISIESAIDRSRLIHVGFALVGIALASGLYKLVSPKDPLATIARVVAPLADLPSPSRVRFQSVEPGSVDVYFGETVDVKATIRGAGDSPVALIYSTDDGQRVNATIPLEPGDAKNEYQARLTTSDAGIQQSLSYWVLAGDGRSSTYHVNVRPSPTIAVSKIELTPPRYTELPAVQLLGQADIEAVEGTKVHLEAIANQPIGSATLELLKAVSAPTSAPRSDAEAEKKLELATIDRIPMSAVDQTASVDFQLLRSGDEPKFTHYRLKFTSREGQRNRFEPVYAVRIKPDLAPEIEVLEPSQTKLQIPANGKLTVKARALDPDFRISAIRMTGLHKGKAVVNQNLVLDQPSGVGNVQGRFDFRPESVDLKAGDEVIFFLAAIDNRHSSLNDQPDPNVTRSQNYELKITAPTDSANPSGNRPSDSPNEGQNSDSNPDESEQNNAADQNSQSKGQSEKSDPSGEEDSQQSGGQAGGNKSENQSSKDDAQPTEGSSGSGNSKANEQNKANPAEDSGESGESSDSPNEKSETGNEPSGNDRPNQANRPEQSKSSDPNNSRAGNPAAPSDNSSGESGKSSDKPTEEAPSQPNDDQSGKNARGENSESSRNQASGNPIESPDEPSQRNSSDTTERHQGDAGDRRPDQNSQPRPGEPNETSRPLDEASHDGERFEKLLEHLDRHNKPAGDKTNSNQSSQQAPSDGGEGNQQSSASEKTGDPNSEAEPKNELGDNSESSDKPKDGGKPADANSSEKSSSGNPSDTGDKAPESNSENGKSNSQSGEVSPKSNQQGSNKASSDQGDGGAEPSDPSSDTPGESDSGADGEKSQSEMAAGAKPNDPSSTDSNAAGQLRPPTNRSQFPDSSTNSPNGLDLKPETPAERELLERTRKVTDLVVDYLKDHQHNPDREMLDEMNWTEQELRDFVKRWEHLRQDASQGTPSAELRYAEALRSLGLRNQTEQSRRAKMQRDQIRNLNEDGSISRPPEKFAEAFRDFSKGRAKRDSGQ